MPPKLSISVINSRVSEEGYTCIDYNSETKKFNYECPNGHVGSMRMDHWRRGVRCSYCSGNRKLDLSYIKDSLSVEGYTLVEEVYNNNKKPLMVKCPESHTYSVSWNNWKTGYRCPYCSGKAKNSVEYIENSLLKENYKLISSYNSNKEKLLLTCPNNHTYKVSWDNWNSRGSRCPKCSLFGRSKEEQDVINFLKSNYSGYVEVNNRKIIPPYELDIVIPDKKLAIEYCGLYWHSELMGKNKNYHLDKLKLCGKRGYSLITIFSDEWLNNREIVESRLMCLIDSTFIDKVYARKCHIKEITASQAKTFCEENHLQGYGAGSKVKLGLFQDEDLVAVMTFSKPSLSKGHKKHKEKVWELHRFCSKKGLQVLGAASKLLKYFEDKYDWKEIFSYADRRWSVGNLYEKTGFDFVGVTQPNYWYMQGACYNRIYRFNLRKKPGDPKNISEWDIRKSQGYNRIWDCGNLKYTKFN